MSNPLEKIEVEALFKKYIGEVSTWFNEQPYFKHKQKESETEVAPSMGVKFSSEDNDIEETAEEEIEEEGTSLTGFILKR